MHADKVLIFFIRELYAIMIFYNDHNYKNFWSWIELFNGKNFDFGKERVWNRAPLRESATPIRITLFKGQSLLVHCTNTI